MDGVAFPGPSTYPSTYVYFRAIAKNCALRYCFGRFRFRKPISGVKNGATPIDHFPVRFRILLPRAPRLSRELTHVVYAYLIFILLTLGVEALSVTFLNISQPFQDRIQIDQNWNSGTWIARGTNRNPYLPKTFSFQPNFSDCLRSLLQVLDKDQGH